MDYLRGEDSHVGQEKQLQFDMQLIESTVNNSKNLWREDFLLVWRKQH